jgi:hypothetical protein
VATGNKERSPIVLEAHRVLFERELCFSCASVFGVLKKFVYEVCAVLVKSLDDPANAAVLLHY